jgi:hypothetical protein
MTTYLYQAGDNVMYNSKCSTIFKHVTVSGDTSARYLLKEVQSGIVHNEILETNLSSCSSSAIIDDFWTNFTYTGDNKVASNYIMTIIKNISSASGLEWGPNSDSTIYSFTASGQTWTKTKN